MAHVDSDEVAVAVLLQGDDVSESYCGECHERAEDWPRLASYHPCSRPGAMFQAELYCSRCMPLAYDESGSQIRTFCGTRHAFTDGNAVDCGCFGS